MVGSLELVLLIDAVLLDALQCFFGLHHQPSLLLLVVDLQLLVLFLVYLLLRDRNLGVQLLLLLQLLLYLGDVVLLDGGQDEVLDYFLDIPTSTRKCS